MNQFVGIYRIDVSHRNLILHWPAERLQLGSSLMVMMLLRPGVVQEYAGSDIPFNIRTTTDLRVTVFSMLSPSPPFGAVCWASRSRSRPTYNTSLQGRDQNHRKATTPRGRRSPLDRYRMLNSPAPTCPVVMESEEFGTKGVYGPAGTEARTWSSCVAKYQTEEQGAYRGLAEEGRGARERIVGAVGDYQ